MRISSRTLRTGQFAGGAATVRAGGVDGGRLLGLQHAFEAVGEEHGFDRGLHSTSPAIAVSVQLVHNWVNYWSSLWKQPP